MSSSEGVIRLGLCNFRTAFACDMHCRCFSPRFMGLLNKGWLCHAFPVFFASVYKIIGQCLCVSCIWGVFRHGLCNFWTRIWCVMHGECFSPRSMGFLDREELCLPERGVFASVRGLDSVRVCHAPGCVLSPSKGLLYRVWLCHALGVF